MMNVRLTMTALAISSALPASAETFSQTYFFGDSQTDTGYFAPMTTKLSNPSGKFITNPDKLWSEHVADHYGTSATSVSANGTNYAVGGALAGTDTTNAQLGGITVPATTTQVANYLSKTGGKADGQALYGMTSGANNLIAAMRDPANATTLLATAATQTANAVKSLHQAGANYFIVPNVPDVGLSPSVVGTAAQAQATTATAGYNTLLQNELANSGANVVPLNMFRLMQEVAASPSTYGFDNANKAACTTSSALMCNQNTLVAQNANTQYFFADSLHPSGGGHALIGDYAVSVLEAPAKMGSIGQHLMQQNIQADNDIHRQINQLPENSNGLWVEMGQQKRYDALGDSNSIPSLSVGASFGKQGSGQTGVHLHAGYQEQQWDNGGGYNTQTIGGGLFHRHDFGKARLTALLNYDHYQIETDRRVTLGAATRKHTANGDGHRLGAGLRAAYRMQPSSQVSFVPYLGVNAQRLRTSALSEDQATLSTAMNFGKNKFESVNGEVGIHADWKFLPNTSLSGSLNYSHNFLDNQDHVSARLKTIPTLEFQLPAAATSKHLASGTIGIRHLVGGSSLNVGITGYKGSEKLKGFNAFMGVTKNF